MRQLRLRMPDDTVRSVMVDENQPVANLMVIVCTKLAITNHDEYSLIATGKHTLNGRRRERPNDGRVLDPKMEQLKKKLKTDEDLAWVDHSKTLDEQDIHEQDVVLLRRRFFYSDQNVDSRDPMQLNLLYVQTRDAILSGTHPVTVDGAAKFAGIQCQAQLGDFVDGKTSRPGYLQLKELVPADYAKLKQLERKIFAEHKKYYGLSELEAKAKYVSEARSLPTYGVTFFLVKEMVPGKNKLVPRLLGITKDCVMRVDADTKGILKTWPLTTVKRWATSMNSFILDFGDYADSYYIVQTSEGEQISQLIAGYIDIIVKRRKAKDHFGIEGDEGATMIEDSVAPSRATIIQNVAPRAPSAAPSVLDLASTPGANVQRQHLEQGPHVEPPEFRPAVEVRGRAEIGYESRPQTQYVTNYELSLPQRDLQDRLEQAQDAVEEAQRVLDRQPQTTMGPNGQQQQQQQQQQQAQTHLQRASQQLEVEQKRRKLSDEFAHINAATAQLVSLSAIPEEELNYSALNSAVETVAASLPSVARDVKIVASLMDDDETGERLIEAARRLCKAFSDLLNAAEPGPTVPRQSLISAASRVGDATQALLYTINQNDASDSYTTQPDDADQLLALAKAVASSAAALVLKAKDVASSCGNEEQQSAIIVCATQCALATSQMVATAKIVAPTVHDLGCQRKLTGSCRQVQRAVEAIQAACARAIRDEALLCEVNDAVTRVNLTLDELLEHVRTLRQVEGAQRSNNNTANRTSSHNNNTSTSTSTTTTTTRTINQSTRTSQHGEREHEIHIRRGPYEERDDYNEQAHEEDEDEDERRSSGSNQDPSNHELVDQARTLARATAQLIQDIRPEQGHNAARQPQQQRRTISSSSGAQPSYNSMNNNMNASSTHNITTITTTLYDVDEQRRRQADEMAEHELHELQEQRDSRRDRPVSMYESETPEAEQRTSASYNNNNNNTTNSELNSNQQRQHHIHTTTTTSVESSQQSKHLHSSYAGHHEPAAEAPQAGQEPASAEAAISGIVGELETTIMFATAGTLRAHDEHDSYLHHRENVLRCAKALVEDTRPLVASAAADRAQLARAAQESVLTMSRLADTVKLSAASLGPQQADSQVNLIRSVKEVACSLSDLIGSTKSALGCDTNDPRLIHVKDSAKGMVSSVSELLRTVKSVEDEQQRGVRAIEATLEAVEYELNLHSNTTTSGAHESADCSRDRLVAAGDELLRVSRPLTMATAKSVHAASGGAQDDAIVAANMGRKAVSDLLQVSREVAPLSRQPELRARIHEGARSCATSYLALCKVLHTIFQHPSIASANPEVKQDLIGQSKAIAACVSELAACGEQLAAEGKQSNSSSAASSMMMAAMMGADHFGPGGSAPDAAPVPAPPLSQPAGPDDQSLVISNRKVSGIAQEISARDQILRKEKELQVAKTQLMAIRKAKYANRPDDYQGYGGALD